MSNVDNRVVNMQFNNAQFEKNISTSLSSIEKLKQGLKFEGVQDNAKKINDSLKGVSFNGLNSGIEAVRLKFSAMQVAAATAISSITTSAMNAGKKIMEELAAQPVDQGFKEYELKMGSVQTIMNSTNRPLKDVNKALNELNTYADKTIYSFSDMTSNIGKFTNSGVELEDATAAIQGVANVAALAGANSQQASHAMYNFAQAISSGSVKLIDWKSIENATMATKGFKEQLIQTALELGTVVEEGDHFVSTTTDMQGNISDNFTALSNFNNSLSANWLTKDVLVKTLAKYTDETTELGRAAFAAAQDVKTFTQLMENLKEAAGSGWAMTFQNIFGDFDEAKRLWTELNNIISPFIEETSKKRNQFVKDWKNLGGREALFTGLRNSLEIIIKVLSIVRDSFYDVFANSLDAANVFRSFAVATRKIADNKSLFENIKNLVTSIFKVLKVGKDIVVNIWKVIYPIFGALVEVASHLIGFVAGLIPRIINLVKQSKWLTTVFLMLKSAITGIVDGIKWLISKLKEFLDSLGIGKIEEFSEDVEDTVTPINKMSDAMGFASEKIEWFKEKWEKLVDWFQNNQFINKVFENIKETFNKVVETIRNFIEGSSDASKGAEKFKIFEKVGGWLKTAFDRIKDFISKIGPALSSFWSWFKETMSKVGDAIKNGKEAFLDFFGAESILDLLKEFVGLLMKLKLSKLMGNMGDWFKTLAEGGGPGSSIKKMSNSISGFFGDLTKTLKDFSKNLSKNKNTIKDIGKSILMIAAAIFIISTIKQEDLTKASVTVAILFGVLIAVSKALAKLENGWKDDLGMSAILKSFSSAILRLSLVAALLGWLTTKIDAGNLWEAVFIMSALATVIGGFVVILSVFGKSEMKPGNIAAMSLMLKVMSSALLKISAIVAILSLFNIGKVLASSLIVSGIIAIMGTFIFLVSKFENAKTSSISVMVAFIKVFSNAILKIGAIIAILSLFSPERIILSTLVIASMSAVLAGLMLLTKIVDKDSILNLGISIAAASTGLLAFSMAIKKLSRLEPEKMLLSVGAILAVVIVLSAIGAVLSALHLDAGILVLSGAMLVFGVAVLAFAKGVEILVNAIDKMNNLGAKGATGVIDFIDAILEKVPSWTEKIITAIIDALMSLTTKVAELLIKFLLAVLAKLTENSATIVQAVVTLLKAIINSLKTVGGEIKMEELVSTLVIVAMMAAIIFLLSFTIENYGKKAYAGILMIALILAEVVAAVFILDTMTSSPDAALKILSGIAEAVLGFAGVIAVITGLALLMQGFGKGDKKFSLGFGSIMKALAVVGIIILGMTILTWLIGFLADSLTDDKGNGPLKNLETAKEIMFKVGEGLASFVSGFAGPILEVFKDSEHIMGSMIGIAALLLATALITPLLPLLGLFIIGLGELGLILEEWFGDGHIEKVFESASKIMAGLGKAIGEFVGGLVSGVFDALSSGFADSIKKFATGLSDMMTELQPFLDAISGVDESTVNSALKVAEMLLAFTGVEILQGITGWITGGVNFEKFGKDLVALAPYLVQFCNKLREGKFNANSVEKSAKAASVLAAFASNLPKEGGWWQKVAGETMDMETFGTKLVAFGKSMVEYGKTVEGITEPQIKAIERTSEVSEDIVKIANSLPAQDGFWQLIAGESDIEEFGKKLVKFGNSILTYALEVGMLNDGHLENVDRSVKMAELVAQLAEKIPREGGIWELIAGKDDLATFGEKIVLFADSMVSFSEKIGRLNIRSANKMDKALEIAEHFSTIAENIKNTDGIDALSKGLEGFAESSVKAFNNVFETRTSEAIGAASDFIGAVARGMHNNQNNVKQEAKNEIQEIIDSVLSPIKDSNADVEDAVKKIIESQIEIINSYTGDGYAFYNAGDNAVQGLINGIKSRIQDAKTAGFDLGYAVYEGTKEGLQEKSPSHIMRDDAAFYAVKGLVLGIKDKLSMVWSSGKEMGSTLYEGTKQSILKIANSVNDNMDLRPVISPVLDLSDVESGAGQINGMLNSRVSSNLAGYTSQLIDRNRMSNYELQINQNGSKEVVSAINNLTSRMDSLEEAILNRPINLDGKKVSKIVAPGINKELGIMQSYARRGN